MTEEQNEQRHFTETFKQLLVDSGGSVLIEARSWQTTTRRSFLIRPAQHEEIFYCHFNTDLNTVEVQQQMFCRFISRTLIKSSFLGHTLKTLLLLLRLPRSDFLGGNPRMTKWAESGPVITLSSKSLNQPRDFSRECRAKADLKYLVATDQ